MTPGTVYWFTGLSGAGKSTLAAMFCDRLRRTGRTVVLLDGDRLRDVFGGDLGHTLEERRASAMRNSRLCKLLAEQGIDVVCATISLFHQCQAWNRTNLARYREIHVRASMETLERRDHKQIYARARRGRRSACDPDIVIDNDGERPPAEIIDTLWLDLFPERHPS